MKCIDWTDVRWAVVKEDGSFAAQHEGSKIFFLAWSLAGMVSG